MGKAFKSSSVTGVTIIVILYLSIDKICERNPLTSDANTETKIPTRTNIIGKRDFFSTSKVISKIGIKIATNKI
jgi:hypothetical protein